MFNQILNFKVVQQEINITEIYLDNFDSKTMEMVCNWHKYLLIVGCLKLISAIHVKEITRLFIFYHYISAQ